jgi:hypothetical protein
MVMTLPLALLDMSFGKLPEEAP